MRAYLQHGGAFCGLPNGPFHTMETKCKETALPRAGRSVTGYGRRIPTCYMVKHFDRWRRVYVCSYGNAGTAYIGPSAAPIATVSLGE